MTSDEIVYSHCLPSLHDYGPPTYGKMEAHASPYHQWGPCLSHRDPDMMFQALHYKITVSSSHVLMLIART